MPELVNPQNALVRALLLLLRNAPMSTRVRLCSAGEHRAPRGGVKDLTAAVRSTLPGRSLTPSPDPGALAHQAKARRGERSSSRVDRFGEGGVGRVLTVMGCWGGGCVGRRAGRCRRRRRGAIAAVGWLRCGFAAGGELSR
jgi:hypothetical protein